MNNITLKPNIRNQRSLELEPYDLEGNILNEGSIITPSDTNYKWTRTQVYERMNDEGHQVLSTAVWHFWQKKSARQKDIFRHSTEREREREREKEREKRMATIIVYECTQPRTSLKCASRNLNGMANGFKRRPRRMWTQKIHIGERRYSSLPLED